MIGRSLRRLERDLAGHRVVRDVAAGLPDVAGDAVLLEQVVTNILDNAAKYAPPGSEVRIAAFRRNDRVVLSVSDEGPGIPEADRKHVFDMFFRVRDGDRQAGGTGLGLAIARGIVDAHGGTIRAEAATAEGGGARLVIELPVAAPAPETGG